LNGVADGITQERSGRKVVVIDDRQESVQQIIAAGGDSGIDIQIDKSALLNNFIKNKLLLDLNYV
jgi:prolyl-tRNA editing enzyme YbaK/EbsC (Cys-tRNA(Pro) deacylase)